MRDSRYLDRLGLISVIRNDFEQLGQLLRDWKQNAGDNREEQGTEGDAKEGDDSTAEVGVSNVRPIERIILYIDDLDRCEKDSIMRILTAMTLLLEPRNDDVKSPFVSVLAIDPRALLGAIEKHFDPDKQADPTQANVNGSV